MIDDYLKNLHVELHGFYNIIGDHDQNHVIFENHFKYILIKSETQYSTGGMHNIKHNT